MKTQADGSRVWTKQEYEKWATPKRDDGVEEYESFPLDRITDDIFPRGFYVHPRRMEMIYVFGTYLSPGEANRPYVGKVDPSRGYQYYNFNDNKFYNIGNLVLAANKYVPIKDKVMIKRLRTMIAAREHIPEEIKDLKKSLAETDPV
jgi:hypothetical protein